MALRDVALLLNYLFKNYDEIIELPKSIEKIFFEILCFFILIRKWNNL